MNRIVTGGNYEFGSEKDASSRMNIAAALHDHTYGITSDPLAQFACVFAALIHDVGHPGVPNVQLIQEDEKLAAAYNYRSVAEQQSFDLAWAVFEQETFADLRRAICDTKSELKRFRELVINAVMATDLADKELKEFRNSRWDLAFKCDKVDAGDESRAVEMRNRKATIVIEHLIQASDVAHTMQHWEVYCEWNGNLFMEMHKAYMEGRAETNPADFWFEGELSFLDFYVVPLSEKLKECGVFGISSDENLNYATENRKRWVSRGREVVAALLEKAEARQAQGKEKEE